MKHATSAFNCHLKINNPNKYFIIKICIKSILYYNIINYYEKFTIFN